MHCPPTHLLPKEHTVLPQDSVGREGGTTVRCRRDLCSQLPGVTEPGTTNPVPSEARGEVLLPQSGLLLLIETVQRLCNGEVTVLSISDSHQHPQVGCPTAFSRTPVRNPIYSHGDFGLLLLAVPMESSVTLGHPSLPNLLRVSTHSSALEHRPSWTGFMRVKALLLL